MVTEFGNSASGKLIGSRPNSTRRIWAKCTVGTSFNSNETLIAIGVRRQNLLFQAEFSNRISYSAFDARVPVEHLVETCK